MLETNSTDLLQGHARSHCASIDDLANGAVLSENVFKVVRTTPCTSKKLLESNVISKAPSFIGTSTRQNSPTQHMIFKLQIHAS